jgi:hypothetical protein
MPNIIRKFFSTLNRTILRRIAPSRRAIKLPIKITVEPDRNTGKLSMKNESLSVRGETEDLSLTGLAFCVDSIRLREHYLVGEGRILNAEIDLPSGKVKMQIIGQRYEQIGEHLSITKYLIGATIANMTTEERRIYEEYLRLGNKVKNNTTPTLGLEVTKS